MHGRVSAASAFPVIAKELERLADKGRLIDGEIDLGAQVNEEAARRVMLEFDAGAESVELRPTGSSYLLNPENMNLRGGSISYEFALGERKIRLTGRGSNYRTA